MHEAGINGSCHPSVLLCLLWGQHRPTYCWFGLSCSYEENRIIPERTLGSRQMVIPTSSPAFPCYFRTSSRDRQSSPPLYFAICQCLLKCFCHRPSLRQSYGSSYCKPILSRIKPLFFSFFFLFFFKFSYYFGRIWLLLLTGLFCFMIQSNWVETIGGVGG